MSKFERHIFICGNVRPAGHPRGCCDPTGRAELQKLFKQKLAERGLKGRVRANQSGCLDQCEHGPNLVVYPEAIWYGGVTLADVDEIVESHIVAGHPVERLMLRDHCLNTGNCEHKPKPPSQADSRSSAEVFAAVAKEVPESDWAKVPRDLSKNVDAYLYDTKKAED